jgi:hypothetical protein
MKHTLRPSATRTLSSRAILASAVVASAAALGACSSDPDIIPPGGSGGAAAHSPAECQQDSDCGAGMACGDDGACFPVLHGDGGAGGSGSGGGCADVEVSFAPVVPTVVLLIDQSGSMTASYPGGNRWDVLYDALMDEQTGVVKALEGDVRFGLALYTSHDGSAGGTCPALTEVEIALDNHAAIDAIYGAASPEDETPTGESLAQVTEALEAFDEPGPKIVILATDGEPDTCAQPNPQNGQAVAIAAAEDAYARGIQTYILAVGNEVGADHLQDMANAGAGLPVGGDDDAAFYQPQTQAELVDAFSGIIDGQRSCVLTLDGEVDPDRADEGEVYLDGDLIGYNDPDGWRLNGPSEIELLGASCDAIKTGAHEVTGNFPCGAVVDVPK